MYISLYDLGMFILFTVALIISGYLIAVLRSAFCVLGQVRGIIAKHDDDINEMLSALPQTLTNINDLSVQLKETADQTNNAFGFLQNNLTDTVDELRDGWETFAIYAKVISEVFRTVFSKS